MAWPAYDPAWLLGVRDLKARGEPWEEEIGTFLDRLRPAARTRALWRARLRGQFPSAADLEDILALANARFIHSGIDHYEGRITPASYYLIIVWAGRTCRVVPGRRGDQRTPGS